jgi:hypothetical protein
MTLLDEGKNNLPLNIRIISHINIPLPTGQPGIGNMIRCHIIIPKLSDLISVIFSLAHIVTSFHIAGHAINDTCYDFTFALSWEGITPDQSDKVSNLSGESLCSFFGLDPFIWITATKWAEPKLLEELYSLISPDSGDNA